MLRMSNPYDPNPQGQPYDQNPQSQPGSNPYQPPPGQYPGGSAPYGQSSPAPYGQSSPAPYGQPYGGVATQEHPQGTMIFVLGIIGIFVGVCAPIAWYLGNKTLREITASGASYSNVSQIRTGRMLGKVFTIIYIVFIVLYVVALIVIFGVAASQGNI
jgi:hypothetical protein